MNVLSLFDGISCGQLALKNAGIPIDTYYSSEIEKYAIQVAQKNFPNTIQLGDVMNIDFSRFIWKIDLLMGGSPCQDLSIAKTDGKGLFGPRSRLFWRFVDALQIIKPKYFLFENVASMKQSNKDTITEILGVKPIEIDSALVSAQRRKRLYWTNIPNVKLPEDRHIYLRDVIDTDNRIYRPFIMNNTQKATMRKTNNYYQYDMSGKGYNSQQDRCYLLDGKVNTLSASRAITKINILFDDGFIRAMTPEEVETCQTLPKGYTYVNGISDNNRDDLVGNGWTIDIISHIFKNIKENVVKQAV